MRRPTAVGRWVGRWVAFGAITAFGIAFAVGVGEAQTMTNPFVSTEVNSSTKRFSGVVVNSAATTLTELVAAPGVGVSLYVTDIIASASVISTTTADQQLTLKYGTGTNCATGTTVFWSSYNLAHDPSAIPRLNTPIKLPANNAICWMHAAVGSKTFIVNGYIAP